MLRHFVASVLCASLVACSDSDFASGDKKSTKAQPNPKESVTSEDGDEPEGDGKKDGKKNPGTTSAPVLPTEDKPLKLKPGDELNLCEKFKVTGAEGSSSAPEVASFDAAKCDLKALKDGPAKILVKGPDGKERTIFVQVGEDSDLASGNPGTGSEIEGAPVPPGSGGAIAVEDFASELVCANRKYRIGDECVDAIPIHRWFNPTKGDHFFTPAAGPGCVGKSSAAAECGGELVNEGGWTNYEGIAFYAMPLDRPAVPGLAPFYRLFKGASADHFYTTSEAEKNNAVTSLGFVLEGAYQVFAKEEPFTKPIHRWYNPTNGDHHFTFAAGPGCVGKSSTAAECGGEKVNEGGWTNYEGVAGYLFPN